MVVSGFLLYFLYSLEEQIAIINDVGLLVELLHETTGSLLGTLAELTLHGLLIEVGTFALNLLDDTEEEGTAITLDNGLAEVTLLEGCHSTCEGC